MGERENNRILWVDIYKALAILLVVVGHATGMFNQYIYQFHLAAFFFISGYVIKLEQESFVKIFVKRLYTLILPLFTFSIVCGLVMDVLYKQGVYPLIFGDLGYIGLCQIIKHFLMEGSIYVWVLGAAWFLITLFIASLVAKLVWNLACGNDWLFIGYTVIVYILGYTVIHKGILMLSVYHVDLALVAQFFYSIGYLVKKRWGKTLENLKVNLCIGGFISTMLIIYFCGRVPDVIIDYAGGKFHNIWLNTFTSIVGIVYLYCLAFLLGRVKCDLFTRVFTVVGQNTMGVVLLHFIMFKVVAVLLYAAGAAQLDEVARTTPSEEISRSYWWLYVLISMIASVFFWMLIKKVPICNVLIGTNKNVTKRLNEYRFDLMKERHMQDFIKHPEKVSMVFLAGCYILMLGLFIVFQYRLHQALDVHFPTYLPENVISFEDGWHPQGNEDYRWIADKGTIVVNHNRHSKLLVSGYVPENFTEITKMDIYIDEQLVETIDILSSRNFEVQCDISDIVNTDNYKVTFDFDGIHSPEKDSTEIRELSGLISRIYIE